MAGPFPAQEMRIFLKKKHFFLYQDSSQFLSQIQLSSNYVPMALLDLLFSHSRETKQVRTHTQILAEFTRCLLALT